jgi:tungstate transport system ATP-binding protein
MSRNDAPLFRLRRVRKQYGGTVAVDVEQLDVPRGEILCLLGPTGAGKSTLLRLLAAVERPTTGAVVFRGSEPRGQPLPLSARRSITMVFQRPVLLAGTVRSNVEYGLRVRDGKGFSPARVERMLELLGLGKLAGQSARTLSGGQTQLVALARALVLEPRALLLDEPTANLDPAHVALVERVIRDDFLRRQTTVVWATHNLFQARRVAQRVALILGGRLVEAAPKDVFFNSPSDPRARDFVEGKLVY